jgi:hypothetical protein
MSGLLEQATSAVVGFFDVPLVRLLVLGFAAYVVLLWFASAWWVLSDLRRRLTDPALPFLAAGGVILASPLLFPLAVVVYRIVRPTETLAEARERRLTERLEALEEEDGLTFACPGCARPVEEEWLLCPSCRTRLAHRCATCGRTMGLDWAMCAWCGAEFGRTILPERTPRPARPEPGLLESPPALAEPRAAAAERALETGV